MENDEVISDDYLVAEISNNQFVTTMETVGIAENVLEFYFQAFCREIIKLKPQLE